MKAYCISGLGADKRAFGKLKLTQLELIHINWIKPQKNETLIDYAIRLSTQINQEEPFVLVGLSFGGMLATEIAKVTNPKKTFIISSIVTRKELPVVYRIAGKLKLQRLVPFSLLKKTRFAAYYLFGAKSSYSKHLLSQIINDIDVYFLRWAIEAILMWRSSINIKCVRIHGERDKVLPKPSNTHAHIISGGGHLVVLEQGDAISKIIDNEVQQID